MLAPLLALQLAAACGGPDDELSRVALRMTAAESARPFTLPSFELTDQNGRTVDLREETAGRFALLFFGYTYCPDVCPISMAVANAALEQLTEAERERVRLVFISVDPRRDTPERISEWLAGLRAPGLGLVTPTVELEKLLAEMGFVLPPTTSWERMPGEQGGYLVPHPASLFLITPDGLGRFIYPFDRATPTEIAEDLRLLMALEW